MLLHSWTFECTGVGTFRDYVQRINVSTMGTVEEPGHPPVIDTGHIPITVMDRAGVQEDVWYRGPIVPMPLTRDPLTYHSADQCRRVTPETGAEDISYAAAFRMRTPAGRRRSPPGPGTDALAPRALPPIGPHRLADRDPGRDPAEPDARYPPARRAGGGRQRRRTASSPASPRSATSTASAPSAALRASTPRQLQQAWNLGSVSEATAILGGDPGATGAVVTAPAQTVRTATTIDQVAADTASLNRLQSFRDQALNAVQAKLGS